MLPRDPDAELRRVVAEHATPLARRRVGVTVGAIANGMHVIMGFGGIAKTGPPPNGRTMFQIGSVTKVFTAVVFADAVERGEVRLDQPLASVIPQAARNASGPPITLLHLATHTSGLPRLPPGLRRQALRQRRDPYADFTTAHLVDALQRAPRRPPGGRPRYSNFGGAVLGEALARATGVTFAELVRDRIATPLGLRDTAINLTADQQSRRATGHSRWGRRVDDWHLPGMPAAGALWSTADDLVQFAAAHLNPDATPLASALRQVMEPRARAADHLRVGLGWHLLDRHGATWLLHNGGTGGFSSFIAIETQAEASICVLSNTTSSVDRLGVHLLDRVRQRER